MVEAIEIMVEWSEEREAGLTKSTGGILGLDLIHPQKGKREGTNSRRVYLPKKRETAKSWLLSANLVGLHQWKSEIALSGRKTNLIHRQMLEELSWPGLARWSNIQTPNKIRSLLLRMYKLPCPQNFNLLSPQVQRGKSFASLHRKWSPQITLSPLRPWWSRSKTICTRISTSITGPSTRQEFLQGKNEIKNTLRKIRTTIHQRRQW